MSVTTKHPAYMAMEYTWQCSRDAFGGSGPVKDAGERYLPRPSGMRNQKDFDDYLSRASWLGATEWGVNGITGAIFRRDAQIDVPTALEPQLQNITRTGMPLRTFVEQVVRETLLMGRSGVLVDFPATQRGTNGQVIPPSPASQPYWIPYITEEIQNWHYVEREGAEHPDMIVLRESVPVRQGLWPTPDYFKIESQEQRRVLRLTEEGFYEVSVWQAVGRSPRPTANDFTLTQSWFPTRHGERLRTIPFVSMTPLALTLEVMKSLMEALVEINFRYYRHSADFEHGLHLTSLPTPWVAGNIDPQQELLIGGLMAWVLPEGSTTGMLEYKGQGLQPQENALLTDVKDMAARAASLLEVAPMVPETMTAMVTRTHGSESPIQSLIRNVSEGITQLLQWSAWWSGLTENPADPAIRYVLNTSLMGPIVESALLKTLMEMLLNNTISAQTWDYNLHRMEIARPGVSFEEEQDLIDLQKEAQPLAMPTRPGTPSPGGRNGATRVAA